MKVDELDEYVLVCGIFRHYLYKCRDFVYLFLVERDDPLFTSFNSSPHHKNLKK